MSSTYVEADEDSLVYGRQWHLSHLLPDTGLLLAKRREKEKGEGETARGRGETERERGGVREGGERGESSVSQAKRNTVRRNT